MGPDIGTAGHQVGKHAHGGDLVEGGGDDRGGRDLGRKRDRDQVRHGSGRTVERPEHGLLDEAVQGLPEEQDAEHSGDGELEAGAVDAERVVGEDGGEHRRHEVERRDLPPEGLRCEHERGDHPGPDGGGRRPGNHDVEPREQDRLTGIHLTVRFDRAEG